MCGHMLTRLLWSCWVTAAYQMFAVAAVAVFLLPEATRADFVSDGCKLVDADMYTSDKENRAMDCTGNTVVDKIARVPGI